MQKRSFTLIELVMVLLIIAIISSVIITDIISSLSATRLGTAKWKLASDILYAQNLSVTQQINHGVIFVPASNNYSLYSQNTTNIEKDPTSPDKNFTVDYSTDPNFKGVSLSSPSFGNRLEFDSFGTPSDGTTNLASNGTITLSSGASNSTVTVTKNTGKVN